MSRRSDDLCRQSSTWSCDLGLDHMFRWIEFPWMPENFIAKRMTEGIFPVIHRTSDCISITMQRFYCVYMNQRSITRFFSWIHLALSSIMTIGMNDGPIRQLHGLMSSAPNSCESCVGATYAKTRATQSRCLFDLVRTLDSFKKHSIPKHVRNVFCTAIVQWMIAEVYLHDLKLKPNRAGVLFSAATNVDRAPLPSLAWFSCRKTQPHRIDEIGLWLHDTDHLDI